MTFTNSSNTGPLHTDQMRIFVDFTDRWEWFVQIWSLVNRCGQFLIQNLELDTCVDILTLGDRWVILELDTCVDILTLGDSWVILVKVQVEEW